MWRNRGIFVRLWIRERLVLLVTIFMILVASLDAVLFFRLIKQMNESTFLLSQFIYPTSFMLVVWTISLLVYRDKICCLGGYLALRQGADEADDAREGDSMDDGNEVPRSHRFSIRQHWREILIMAVTDSITGAMSILPILYLPSIVLLLLNQLNLPLNMFLSRIVLKYEYQRLHYLGAATVIMGVLTASYSELESKSNDSLPADQLLFWTLLLLMAKFIDAYVTIYRETKLKNLYLKPWHVTAWVSLIQTGFSLGLLPIALIHFPPPYKAIPVLEFGHYIVHSLHILSLPENLILFIAFLFFNIIYNVLSLTLVQLKSSNYAILMAILRLGITAFLLTQPWIAGLATHALSYMHVVGFAVMILGVSSYSYLPSPAQQKQQDAEETLSDHDDDEQEFHMM